MYASQQTIELIYCFVLDIWLAGFKNFGKLFCQLIGFHCLGCPGFSKHTVTMRFIAWNLLFKKLTIPPYGRVLVWVPHPNPVKFCIILPFNYCCFWDLPTPTMSVRHLLEWFQKLQTCYQRNYYWNFKVYDTKRGNYDGCQKYQ